MPKQTKKSVETRSSGTRARRASRSNPLPTREKMSAVQYMSRMMARTVHSMNTKIAELEAKISASSSTSVGTSAAHEEVSNYQSVGIPGPVTLCYPMTQPAEKPKFPGKNKHPVTFIEDLTAYLRKCTPGADYIIDTIVECLEGESRNWARIYRERWTQFEDFKRDFLDTYWGEAEQNNLRRKIVQGSWDETQSTMLEHFITLCGQAKMLTYPIQEKQLISDIMNHYPKDVQYSWSSSNYTSILQATEFLRKLDNVNKQAKYISDNGTQANSIQKPAAVVHNHHERKNTFARNRQFNDRTARQTTSSKPVNTSVISVTDNNNSANVTSEKSINLNE